MSCDQCGCVSPGCGPSIRPDIHQWLRDISDTLDLGTGGQGTGSGCLESSTPYK